MLFYEWNIDQLKKLIIYSFKTHYPYLSHLSHICPTKINNMYTDTIGLQDIL